MIQTQYTNLVYDWNQANDLELKKVETLDILLSEWLQDTTATGNKEAAIKRIKKAWMDNKKELSLSHLELNQFPPGLHYLNLQQLNLSSNRIKTLSTEVGKFLTLKKFYLDSNKLKSLPKEIGNLPNLESLSVRENKLQTVPKEIEHLVKLKRLNVECNKIKALPKEIGNLPILESLSVSNNEIETIPKEIGKLSTLQWLDLFNNPLKELPIEIGQLFRLLKINLTNTKLSFIPIEIGQIFNLRGIDIYGLCNLRELPLSLGEIIYLKEINIGQNTPLSPELINAFLSRCQAKRAKLDLIFFRLRTWYLMGGNASQNFEAYFRQYRKLTDSQLDKIDQWLLKLEKIKDYQQQQQTLAQTALAILV